MAARAVVALDVAAWRNRQMNTPVFMVIPAKTGVAMDRFSRLACSAHIFLPLLNNRSFFEQ
jgi:hypothetical protein